MHGIEFIPLSPDCTAPGSFDCALALGCFDGFHRAHRMITSSAAELARRLSAAGDVLLPGAFCFSEPPAAFFGKDVPIITDTAEKCRLFAEAGLAFALVADFSAVREMPPADFMRGLLYGDCRCRAAACGFNFTFGKNAEGTPRDLESFFGADRVSVCAPLLSDGETVSSSRIRRLIAEGDIPQANDLLGHPFSVCGTVRHGRGDGKKLGFPTINQLPADGALRPAAGVYVSAVKLPGSDALLPAVTDAGVAPTMDMTGIFRYETHLLDAVDVLLYGESPRVFLYKRLRGEMKFAGPSALVAQISRDSAAAREYLRENGIK